MKQALAALAVMAVLAFGALQAPAPALAADKQRVVLQVSDNDPKKWNLALNNAKNVQQALGKENVDVEIVAYGPGLNMLKADSKVAPRLAAAMDDGVVLNACGNTMRNTKVSESDLAGGVKIVDAGVIHIMQRQREGWAYVKP